jgi:DNA-binding GntR family transcriptional regulator
MLRLIGSGAIRDQESRRQLLTLACGKSRASRIAARDADRAAKEMAIHLDHIEETTRRTMKGK